MMWRFLQKEDLELSLIDTIIPKLEIYKPDIIINAAYTKVDLSEKNKINCDINANAVTEIAKYSLQNDIELIHYSMT